MFPFHNCLAVTGRADNTDWHHQRSPRQLALDTSNDVVGQSPKARWKLHSSKHTADLYFTASYSSEGSVPDLRVGLTYIYLTLGESTYLTHVSVSDPKVGHIFNK